MINFNFRAGIVGVVFVLLTSLRLLLAQTASQTFRTVESPTIMGVSELGNTADGVCSPGSSYSVRAFLDSSLDFKEDILRTIQSSGKNEAVHLYSHGTPGLLFLDGKWRDQYDIVTWIQDNKLLANQTQLNIYGCNFAKGLSGQAAVSHIEAALGVKVAASDNITGKGGDWNLEVGNGQSAIAVKNYPAALQLDCPVLTTPAYPKSVDLIITSYHQHIARGQNVFFTWGEDMAANGANATVMTPITPANGYNYTGAIRMFAVSGNTDGQGFLLTTTGLYAWGSRLEVLGAPLATSNSFSAVALPAGVAANDVLDIKANSDVLFLVTNAGEVYVTGLVVTQVAGNGAPVNNQWNRVKINATTNLTGVVELSGSREAVYARKADGTLWTWGRGVALGGGAAPATQTFATQMNLTGIPVGVTLSQLGTYMDNVAFTAGLLVLGSNGRVYGIGYDGNGQLISNTGNWVSTWTSLKNSGGTDITNIVFLSTSENSEALPSAAIITTVTGSTNRLWSWGTSELGNIGFADGRVNDPTIPNGFVIGTDNPVYTSVGGHAISFLNTANGGTICFVGHITDGSGAGLQTDQSRFQSFNANDVNWPPGVLLCGQNAPPVAIDDIVNVTRNTPAIIDVLDLGTPDSDPESTITITRIGSTTGVNNTTTVQGGTISINRNGTPSDPTDDFINYNPPNGFTGTDTFYYEISDAQGFTDIAKVTVNVVLPPAPPVAGDDNAFTTPGTTITLNVLNNDIDPNLDINPASFTFQGPTTTPNGGVFSYSGGVVTFVAHPTFTGTETINYQICDSQSPTPVCDIATITISIDNRDANGCIPGETYSLVYTKNAVQVVSENEMENSGRAVGRQNNLGSRFRQANAFLVLDIGEIVPKGDTINIYLARKSGVTGRVDITTSDVNSGFGNALQYTITANEPAYNKVAYVVTNTSGVRYVRLSRNSATTGDIFTDGLMWNRRICLGGCTLPEVKFATVGNGVTGSGTAGNPARATGAPDNIGADIKNQNLVLDLGQTVTQGSYIVIYAASEDDNTFNFSVSGSLTNGSYTGSTTFATTVKQDTYAQVIYQVTQVGGIKFLRISTGDVSKKVFIDAVTYRSFTCGDATPKANNDALSLCQNFNAVIPVQANDTDPKGSVLTTSILTGPTNGTATVTANGSISYTPNLQFAGTEVIRYQVCNNVDLCSSANLTITVLDNGCPTGQQSSAIVGTVTTNVLSSGDAHLDQQNAGKMFGTCTEIELTSKPDEAMRGLLKFNIAIPATAVITSATLRLRETGGDEDGLVVNVHKMLKAWTESNDCNQTGFPNWNNVSTGTPWTAAGGDFSPTALDGQAITLKNAYYNWNVTSAVQEWAAGAVNYGFLIKYANEALNNNNTFASEENGTSAFRPTLIITYTDYACGGTCVPIPNQKPEAFDDSETTPEDTPVNIDVLDQGTPDTDFETPINLNISSAGSTLANPSGNGTQNGGTVSINNNGTPANNTDDFIVYTPALNFVGEDAFYYVITDAGGLKDTAQVVVTVTPVNDPPVAIDDVATTPEDTPVIIDILDQGIPDSDPESNVTIVSLGSDPLNPVDFSSTQGGSVTLSNNGTPLDPTDDFIEYTPRDNYFGQDTVYYVIRDVEGLTDIGRVIITVTPVSDPPVAVQDNYTVQAGGSVPLTPLDLDFDLDGDVLTIVSINGVALTPGTPQSIPVPNGTVTTNAVGGITFTPTIGFAGSVTFPYVITDGTTPATANQNIEVICTPPAAPTASVTSQPTCATPTGTIVVTIPVPAANIRYTITGTNPVVAGVTQASATFAGLAPGVYSVTATNTNGGCTSPPTSLTVDAPNCADLSVTKTDGVTTYTAGTTTTYTVVVANAGPSNVVGASFVDNIPAGTTWSYTSVVSGGASGNTASGTVNISDALTIPNGGTVTYTVVLTIPSSFTGNLTNTASITAPVGTTDLTQGNNSATDTDTPAPVANLAISKTDGSATYTPGSPITYTIVVTNNGPSNVTGATVADAVPATITGVTWTTTTAGTASVTSGATGSGNTLASTVNLASGSGNSVTFTVTGTVSSSATGNLVNTATTTVPGGTTDPTAGNNSATDTDTAAPVADLSVTKTVNNASQIVGSEVVFTLIAMNNGPSDATNVSVTDQLPSGYQFVSDNGLGTYVSGTGVWTVGTLANGASESLQITAKVKAVGVYLNRATISGEQVDPDATNDTTSRATTPSVIIVASHDNLGVLVADSSIMYSILRNDSLNNASPIDTSLVTVSLTKNGNKGVGTINANGTLTYIANPGVSGMDSLVYTICDKLNQTICDTALVVVRIEDPLLLKAKVYLQGALFKITYSDSPTNSVTDSLMRDDLRVQNLIPLASPYSYWNPTITANTIDATVLSAAGRNSIVDWVFVELRDNSDSTKIVTSRSALLQRDGDIVGLDGTSPLEVRALEGTEYYVVVRHRNHLAVMTANFVPISKTGTTIDFRDSIATPTYILAPEAINRSQVVVHQGMAMWAGNAKRDDLISYEGAESDEDIIFLQVVNAPTNSTDFPFYSLKGYLDSDINMNGEVTYQGTRNDLEFIYQNIIRNHPGNSARIRTFSIKEQLPDS